MGRGQRTLDVDRGGELVLVSGLWGRGWPRVVPIAGGDSAESVADGDHPLTGFVRGWRGCFDQTGKAHVFTERELGVRDSFACSCGGHLVRIHTDETISITEIGNEPSAKSETLRGRVLEIAAYDCERQLLALSLGPSIHVFACDASHRVRRRIATIKGDGGTRVAALAATSGTIASVTAIGAHRFGAMVKREQHEVRIHRADIDVVEREPVLAWTSGYAPSLRARAIASDDREGVRGAMHLGERVVFAASSSRALIALDDGRAIVLDADAGLAFTLEDHQAPIVFLRFCGDRVASVDERGKLIVR